MKIAIVRNAGSAMGSRVLQGVYGALSAEEGAAKGSFRFAPEFTRVSHLFSAISSGEVDLEVSGVEVVEVPDNLVNDFKAQLMHQMGARWQSLYAQVLPAQGDSITRALLLAESARVTEGVTTHMATMGNRLYKVIASVEAQTPYRSNEYRAKADMMVSMRPIEGAQFSLLDVELSNRPAGTAPGAADAVAEADAQQTDQVDQQIHFEGHRAAGVVTYEIEVAASSREGAAALAQFVLNDNSMREAYISQSLTATPVKLENVRQGDALSYGDTAYDEDHDLDEEGGHRPY